MVALTRRPGAMWREGLDKALARRLIRRLGAAGLTAWVRGPDGAPAAQAVLAPWDGWTSLVRGASAAERALARAVTMVVLGLLAVGGLALLAYWLGYAWYTRLG